MLLDCGRDFTHVHTRNTVILTWRSWWKAPVFVLEPPQLPCLRADVTQRGEMNWVNPTHRVGLTKHRWDEWWFTVAAAWPASLMISRELERFSLNHQNSLWFSFLVHRGSSDLCTTGAERTRVNDAIDTPQMSKLNVSSTRQMVAKEHRTLAREQQCRLWLSPTRFPQRAFMVVVSCPAVIWTGMIIYIMGNEDRERRGGTQKIPQAIPWLRPYVAS